MTNSGGKSWLVDTIHGHPPPKIFMFIKAPDLDWKYINNLAFRLPIWCETVVRDVKPY